MTQWSTRIVRNEYPNKRYRNFANGSKQQADYLLWLRNEIFLALGIPEGDRDRRAKGWDLISFLTSGLTPAKIFFTDIGITDEVLERRAKKLNIPKCTLSLWNLLIHLFETSSYNDLIDYNLLVNTVFLHLKDHLLPLHIRVFKRPWVCKIYSGDTTTI